MEHFYDKNNIPLLPGVKVKLRLEVKVGELTLGQGRTRRVHSKREEIEIFGTIKFGRFNSPFKGELITYYFQTEENNRYQTGFYAGCGRTQSEKQANASVVIEENLSQILTGGLAEKCEVMTDPA